MTHNKDSNPMIYYATSESSAFCKYNIGNQQHTATASASASASALSPQEAKTKAEEISAIRAEEAVRELVNTKK